VSATPKYIDGRFVRHCNAYYVSRDRIVEPPEVCGGLAEAHAPIRFGKLMDGFDDEYYGVLASVLPSGALLPCLAPSEKDRAGQVIRNVCPT